MSQKFLCFRPLRGHEVHLTDPGPTSKTVVYFAGVVFVAVYSPPHLLFQRSQTNIDKVDKLPTFLPNFVYFISKNKCLITRFFCCFFMIQYVHVNLIHHLPYKTKQINDFL